MVISARYIKENNVLTNLCVKHIEQKKLSGTYDSVFTHYESENFLRQVSWNVRFDDYACG